MGADIHFVIESLDEEQNLWVGIYATETLIERIQFLTKTPLRTLSERDYSFFANLAGVRGAGPKANGLPNDASQLTLTERGYWDTDGHSEGHCSLYDFIGAKLKNEDRVPKAVAWRLANKDPVLMFLGVPPEDAYELARVKMLRVCFWFDN